MICFLLGFIVGGCSGVILMGIIGIRRNDENEQ